MNTTDVFALLVVLFVGFAFVLDLLGATFAALRKKEYKSMIGKFVDDLADNPPLWWLPAIIALIFVYGLFHVV